MGLPTNATGDLVFFLGGMTSSIFPSLGPTSSFLLGDLSIMIGSFVGDCDFPFLILVPFLVLKYRGPCLGCLFLGLTGVPNVVNVETTSCSVSPGDRIVLCGCFYAYLGLEVSFGITLSYTFFSPSSPLICASPSSIFPTSLSFVFISYSSIFSASYSYIFSPYSSSIFRSLPPML